MSYTIGPRKYKMAEKSFGSRILGLETNKQSDLSSAGLSLVTSSQREHAQPKRKRLCGGVYASDDCSRLQVHASHIQPTILSWPNVLA
jgi:hypothetical protein